MAARLKEHMLPGRWYTPPRPVRVEIDRSAAELPEVRRRLLAPGHKLVWSRGSVQVHLPADEFGVFAARRRALGTRARLLSPGDGPPAGDTPEEVEAALAEAADTGAPRALELWSKVLLPFQRECVLFATGTRNRGAVWADPGAGKTLIAIAWALAQQAAVGQLVVVVTRSAVRGQWLGELLRWSGVEGHVLWPASAPKRVRHQTVEEYLATHQRPVVIVGWEALSDWVFTGDDVSTSTRPRWPDGPLARLLLAQIVAPILVLDESHYAKDWQRARKGQDADGGEVYRDEQTVASAGAWLGRLSGPQLQTTGTPVAKAMSDLWAQLDILEPDRFGTFHAFSATYCGGKRGEFGWIADMSRPPGVKGWDYLPNVHELRARRDPVRIRVPWKVALGELPPLIRVVQNIPPEDQGKPGTGFHAARRAAGGNKKRLAELLLQEAAERCKAVALDLVREYLGRRDGHGKVLIFAGRNAGITDLAATIGKLPIKPKVWATSEGENADRSALAAAYMAHPGPCVLVTTTEAMGESSNLQDTDLLLWQKLPTTPRKLVQGEGRVRRLRMSRPCESRFLVPEGTYAEHLRAMLLDRLPAFVAALDAEAAEEAMADFNAISEEEHLEKLFAGVATAMARATRTAPNAAAGGGE